MHVGKNMISVNKCEFYLEPLHCGSVCSKEPVLGSGFFLCSMSRSQNWSYLIDTDVIGPRLKGGASTASVLEGDPHRLEQALASGEGRATLKMKRDGQAVVEEVVSLI